MGVNKGKKGENYTAAENFKAAAQLALNNIGQILYISFCFYLQFMVFVPGLQEHAKK